MHDLLQRSSQREFADLTWHLFFQRPPWMNTMMTPWFFPPFIAFHFMILATHCLGSRAGYFFYAPPLPLAPPEGVHLYSPFLGPIAGDRGGDWKDMVSYVHWSFLLGSYLVRRCGTVVHHEHAKALMSLHSVPVWLFLRAALIFCAFNLCLSQVLFAQTYLENIGANKSSS